MLILAEISLLSELFKATNYIQTNIVEIFINIEQ